jgi:site-specific recombinase XerD
MKKTTHALELALQARIAWLATTLRPSSVLHYRYTVRLFVLYLRQNFPGVERPQQLRRDPHLLGWLEFLWTRQVRHTGQPWRTATRAEHVVRLRTLLELLSDHPCPPRPGLLRREDIPRREDVLPRPLTTQQDAWLLAELRRRQQDWLANALLLTRLTGMRIGETADLSADCLRHLDGDQWVLHVPLGKMHNDRWVPVDPETRTVLVRLQYLRTLPPAAPPEFLLPRPTGRNVLVNRMRAALHQIAREGGITARIVPHQLRHTYATSLLRAGISLPALMKLLGHRNANMTLRYVEITQHDLQREFHQALAHPRHLAPLPSSAIPSGPEAASAPVIREHLSGMIRLLDLFRQQNPGAHHKDFQLLLRRLTRIRSRFEKLIGGS